MKYSDFVVAMIASGAIIGTAGPAAAEMHRYSTGPGPSAHSTVEHAPEHFGGGMRQTISYHAAPARSNFGGYAPAPQHAYASNTHAFGTGYPSSSHQGYGSQRYASQSYGSQSYGSRGYGAQSYGSRSYGSQGYASRGYGSQSYGSQGYGLTSRRIGTGYTSRYASVMGYGLHHHLHGYGLGSYAGAGYGYAPYGSSDYGAGYASYDTTSGYGQDYAYPGTTGYGYAPASSYQYGSGYGQSSGLGYDYGQSQAYGQGYAYQPATSGYAAPCTCGGYANQ